MQDADAETWHARFAHAREAFRAGDWERAGAALTEASLSRVLHHAQQAGTHGLTLITAWKGSLSRELNQQNMESLRRDIESSGYGYNRLRGHWRDTATGKIESEPSFAVHNMTLAHARKFGQKYKQEMVLHASPETQGRMHALNLVTGTHTDAGEFHTGRGAVGWSELLRRPGREFVFEYAPDSVAESQLIALHETRR